MQKLCSYLLFLVLDSFIDDQDLWLMNINFIFKLHDFFQVTLKLGEIR